MSPTTPPSNSESIASNVLQARLPGLTPEFVARHYPSTVSVVHVHAVNRHGERTPSSHNITGISPKSWNLCAKSNQMHADFQRAVGLLVSSGDATEMQGRAKSQTPPWEPFTFAKAARDISELVNLPSASTADAKDGSKATAATCGFGQLTDLGRQSMTALGAHMRALYVDALGFLPPAVSQNANGGPTDDLYLRATMYTRTFESLQHILGGLYPGQEPGSSLFRVNVRPAEHETIYSRDSCRRMMLLFKELSKACMALHAAERQKLYTDMRNIPALREYLDAGRMSEKSHHLATTVLDTAASAYVHGLPLPDAIDGAFMARLSQSAAVEHMLSGWKSAALARLQIGPLLHEFAANVAAVVETDRAGGGQHPKMAIYSAHDTTLAPLLATFGSEAEPADSAANLSELMWPPFASSIRIELLKDSQSPYPAVRPAWEDDQKDYSEDASLVPFEKRTRPVNVPKSLYRWSHATKGTTGERNPRATRDYYVRVWYNDRALQLPTCRDPGAHHTQLGSSVCTLDGFFKQIARFVPSKKEAAQECLC